MSARRGAIQTASGTPTIAPSSTGSLSIRSAKVQTEVTTLEKPWVRSSSCARPAVAVSE